jgi:helix-turn-helix protein
MTAADSGSGSRRHAGDEGDGRSEHGDVAKGRSELLEAYRQRDARADDEATRGVVTADGSEESIVVDFIANFVAGGNAAFEQTKGRVLMSDRRLVLVTSGTKTTIPIASVFDIAVGQVPPEVEQFFDYTVMVGYVEDNYRKTTVIGGDRETIEKFSLLLFRAVLNGSAVLITHPAKVGGRVMDAPQRRSGLRLDYESVRFVGGEIDDTDGESTSINLASVVFFEVVERSGDDGGTNLVLSVQHVEDGRTVTSEITMSSRRKMNILGRYLRLIYHWIKSDVRDVDVGEHELEVLVGLYSTTGDIDLASLLGVDDAELDAQLASLHEDGLITDAEPPVELTPQGRFIVNEEFEDVNV